MRDRDSKATNGAGQDEAFSVNPLINEGALRDLFERSGRIEIRDFLAAGQAERLRRHLTDRRDWRLVLNAGSGVYEIPRDAFASLSADQKRELDERVIHAARAGFHYRYESIRVPDEDSARERGGSLLESFVRFLSSEPVLELVRTITGAGDIGFADGQATAYSSGHFLTRHDDDAKGKGRRAAFVFGLQPGWSADWGGLLMFHGEDGNIEEAFTPAMGALRLFRVPAPHSVSYVTPFAPEPRLSVTGWFRVSR